MPEIIRDQVIRNKYHSGFSRNVPVTEIVLHGTMGGGTYRYMVNGERGTYYKKGEALFHYLIEESGRIIEIIDPDRWVYHSSSSGHDRFSIGIEFEKNDRTNLKEPNAAQYAAIDYLLRYLLKRFPRVLTITGHDYNAAKYSNRPPKPCPGGLNWERIIVPLGFKKQGSMLFTRSISDVVSTGEKAIGGGVLLILGIGGYLLWRYYRGKNNSEYYSSSDLPPARIQ